MPYSRPAELHMGKGFDGRDMPKRSSFPLCRSVQSEPTARHLPLGLLWSDGLPGLDDIMHPQAQIFRVLRRFVAIPWLRLRGARDTLGTTESAA